MNSKIIIATFAFILLNQGGMASDGYYSSSKGNYEDESAKFYEHEVERLIKEKKFAEASAMIGKGEKELPIKLEHFSWLRSKVKNAILDEKIELSKKKTEEKKQKEIEFYCACVEVKKYLTAEIEERKNQLQRSGVVTEAEGNALNNLVRNERVYEKGLTKLESKYGLQTHRCANRYPATQTLSTLEYQKHIMDVVGKCTINDLINN